MERKKPAPQASSGSDESSSHEEEGSEQNFVRTDRKPEKIEDKKAHKAPAAEEEEDEEEDDDDDEEDDDDRDIDGTQGGTAEDASSSETTQAGHAHEESNSSSETSSASAGKPGKPSHQFVVIPRKAEKANGHGKKTPTLEKPVKVRPAPEISPKKSKDKAFKRDREEPQEKGSKKQKKESSDKPSKTEKVSKEKSTPSHTSEKKTDAKKSAQSAAVSENPKIAPPQQNSSKKPDNALAKKPAEKSKTDKKATKDTEPEPLKGPVSPSKPKTFTPKDELVLTKEILRDIKEGIGIPVKKVDGYWSTLVDRVKGRMEGSWSKEQLCEKVKRMKVRYSTMAEKFRDLGERKFRNSTDKELFGLWDQIWGTADAMDVDNERDASEIKDKQPEILKAASPGKEGKTSRNKVVGPTPDAKIAHEESEGPKSKQTEKEISDDDDDSESRETNGEGDSHKKGLPMTRMEVEHKDAHADCALIPKGNTVQGHENKAPSHPISDAQNHFQDEIRATLLEIQESSKQALNEWQSKALVVVENAVKAVADQSRLMNGIGVAGFDGLSTPLRCLDLIDSQRTEGNQALEQQWHELRLKELDLYRQKLELMQRECQLKQDQLKLQFHRNK